MKRAEEARVATLRIQKSMVKSANGRMSDVEKELMFAERQIEVSILNGKNWSETTMDARQEKLAKELAMCLKNLGYKVTSEQDDNYPKLIHIRIEW